MLTREENNKEKKRSPTPVPGYLSRKRKEKAQEELQLNLSIENELILADLESKYSKERQRVEISERKVQILEKDLKAKIKKID
jgi:hypothetical protein